MDASFATPDPFGCLGAAIAECLCKGRPALAFAVIIDFSVAVIVFAVACLWLWSDFADASAPNTVTSTGSLTSLTDSFIFCRAVTAVAGLFFERRPALTLSSVIDSSVTIVILSVTSLWLWRDFADTFPPCPIQLAGPLTRLADALVFRRAITAVTGLFFGGRPTLALI